MLRIRNRRETKVATQSPTPDLPKTRVRIRLEQVVLGEVKIIMVTDKTLQKRIVEEVLEPAKMDQTEHEAV
jgi:hypothetical protein